MKGKGVATIGASLALAFSLAGCGGTGAHGNNTQASSSGSQVTTITMLTHWDASTAKQFQPYIDEYEKLHPNIKINLQTVDFGDLLKKIDADELAGNGPDIFHIYSLWLPDLAKGQAVAPAQGNVLQDIQQGYRQNILQSVSVKDQVYGYPTEIDDYALIYNKKLFADAGISSPPATWQDLEADAKKLTKRDSSGKIVQQGFGTITGWDSGVVHPWLTMYWSDGGTFLKPDFTGAQLDSPQAKETLGLYQTLLNDKVTNPQMSLSNDSTTGGYQSNFQLGRTGMIIMADWWEGGLQSTMGANFNNVGTAPIPVGPSGTQSTSLFYTWMYTVNAHSKHQQEAWAFLQWLNSPAATGKSSRMGDWLMGQGIIPSRTTDQAAHQTELGTPFMKTYVDALATAQPFPIVLGGAEITTDLQQQIENVEFGKAPVEQALSTAQSQINSVLQANYGG